jgi:hypothetical protein
MMKRVDFLGVDMPRLLIGDNPVNGHSYIPELISQDDMLDYYTEANVMAAMAEAARFGCDAWMPLANEFMLRAIRHYRAAGGTLNVIFQTYPAVDWEVNLRQMQQCRPVGIYHQGTTLDTLCEEGKFQLIRDRIKMAKDLGLKAGIGSHVPDNLKRAEDEDWGCDFYAACLHNTRKRGDKQLSSFITGKPKHVKFYAEDRAEMLATIRQIPKPVIAFKVFAGGQLFYHKSPEEIKLAVESSMTEVFSAIKPGDVATIGCFQRDKNQLAENIAIAKRVLARG